MNAIESSGYADFEWAVQLNRFSLKLVGLWPQETTSPRERLYSNLRLFVTVIAHILVFTIPSLHLLVKVWADNMTAVIDNMLYTLPLVTIPLKLLIMWWKRETLSPLMVMIAHDWTKPKSNEERDIMVHNAQNARLIIAFIYIVTIITITIMIVATGLGYNLGHAMNITGIGKPLPMPGYYVYDTSVSPQFEITFIMQCFVLVTIALSYTGLNNFVGFFIFHICGQLKILAMRLQRMRKAENFMEALRINVMDHIRLLRSIAIIENAFALLLLLLFLYFGTLFCIYGFLVVTVIFEENNISIKKAAFLIMAICTASLNMCIYCAVGELLMIKYDEVYNAVYECEWYTLRMKEAKNLIFLIMRMNKPLCITAGKLLPMTMSTFCSILKTSGGYISVLLANRN